jgi:hypothetical protein
MTPAMCTRLARPALLALAPLVALLAYAPDSRACACCADPGERIEATNPLQDYEKAQLARVRFGKKARLYLNAAGLDVVTGISTPSEAYALALARQGDRWTFTLRDAAGHSGTLAFDLPATVEAFFVDPHDGLSDATDPVLFKEWRLTAPLTGTGIFSAGAAGATVRLILQGRGNGCTSAEQFTAWTLIVSGPKARYTLHGSLAAPAP